MAACLLSLFVGLAGGEVAARWLGTETDFVTPAAVSDRGRVHDAETLSRPNARFLWVGHPGRRREFEVFVRNNSLGFHDEEHALRKRPGWKRVLVVGDSFVQALQVPLQAGMPRQLARRLRSRGGPVDVVAVAQSGWGPVEYGAAIAEWAPRLDADVVVCCFYPGNDVRNASKEAERLFAKQVAGPLGQLWNRTETKDLPGLLVPSSRLNALLARLVVLHQLRGRFAAWEFEYKIPVDFYVFTEERFPFVEEGWRTLSQEVAAVKKELAAQGRLLLVTSTSDAFRLHRDAKVLRRQLARDYPEAARWHWDFGRFEARLGSILSSLEIPYVDLERRLAARMRSAGRICHFPADGHWNEEGHAWAAEELEPRVSELLGFSGSRVSTSPFNP